MRFGVDSEDDKKPWDLPTTVQAWARSEKYHNPFLLKPDPSLEETVQNMKEKGVPDWAVSANEGKELKLIAQTIGAKKIIEVGTQGGYSTIWLAQALLDDGELITFEIDPHNATVAGENIAVAGLASKVNVVVGPALQGLQNMHPTVLYDFAFIDADKESDLAYFKECKRLVRMGGLIVVDNVVMNGLVSKPGETDEAIEGVRRLPRYIKDDQEVEATITPIVGKKGYDGYLLAQKL